MDIEWKTFAFHFWQVRVREVASSPEESQVIPVTCQGLGGTALQRHGNVLRLINIQICIENERFCQRSEGIWRWRWTKVCGCCKKKKTCIAHHESNMKLASGSQFTHPYELPEWVGSTKSSLASHPTLALGEVNEVLTISRLANKSSFHLKNNEQNPTKAYDQQDSASLRLTNLRFVALF